jgi:hypothetical protein
MASYWTKRRNIRREVDDFLRSLQQPQPQTTPTQTTNENEGIEDAAQHETSNSVYVKKTLKTLAGWTMSAHFPLKIFFKL